ncbi:DUF5134 domain-containing protein [uncultured Mycobacterium sp.]|uniref:DUF5134 domain-containing protein n=1 Tax=uncultured Mycobacterium sp. TaxID=171292 RepID=UPI0035CC9AE3
MIHDLMLRWVVTALWVLGAADSGLAIVTKRRPWTFVVNNGLHLVMSVAMAVMAWPRGAEFPTTGLVVFFLLAAMGFVTMAAVAARTTARWWLFGYHGLMMLATAWLYAIMNGHLLPLRSSTPHQTQPGMSMPGTEMAEMNMPASSGSPVWFTVVNWFGTVSFAIAAAFWIYKYFRERKHEATGCSSLGNLAQAAMAAGMAIMFRATLSRI